MLVGTATFLCVQGGTQSVPCCQQAEGFQEGGGLLLITLPLKDFIGEKLDEFNVLNMFDRCQQC